MSGPKVPSLLAVLILVLIALIRPGIGQEVISKGSVSADYGIFSSIEELHGEQLTREDDPRVLNAARSALDSIRYEERAFEDVGIDQLTEEELEIPEPITQSPVVFDALKQNPIVNNTNILDWILPPPTSEQGALNYLLFFKNGDRTVWKLGSIVPKLGIFTDSGLDKWLYIDVDGDTSTGDLQGNDIRARMTFAKELLARDWDVSLFPPSLKFNNAGIKMEIQEIDPSSSVTNQGGSLYFIKGISYSEKNYIWSVGVGLDEFKGDLSIRVSAREWRAEPNLQLIQQLLQGGVLNLGDLNFLEIVGPFTLSYDFDSPPKEMNIFISVMRLAQRSLQDMAYIKLDLIADDLHDTIISSGSLVLGVSNMGSPIDSVEWKAGDDGLPSDSITMGIRYVEFSDDLVDANIRIPSMPGSLRMDLEYSTDTSGRNTTILDLSVPQGLPELEFLEVIYPSWDNDQDLEDWNATKLTLFGIPERIHLETTAAVPFDVDSTTTPSLNILDTFMSQIAGRFYRLGEILREIPRAISEMPSRKGSTLLDCKGGHINGLIYISTSGTYYNGTGDLVTFSGPEGEMPSIFASLHGVEYYKGSFFEAGNDITLRLHNTPNLKIYALSGPQEALLEIKGIPEQIHLSTSQDIISYEGTSGGDPERIDSIGYRYPRW